MKTDRLRRKWRRFVGWLRVLPITLAGCVPETGPCGAADIRAIDELYATELLTACAEYDSLDECPDYPRISAEDDKRREEFVRCRP